MNLVVGAEAHCSARYRGGCTPRKEASSGVACWWKAGGGSDMPLGCVGRRQQQQGILKPAQGMVLWGRWAAGGGGMVSQRFQSEMGSVTLAEDGGQWGCWVEQ